MKLLFVLCVIIVVVSADGPNNEADDKKLYDDFMKKTPDEKQTFMDKHKDELTNCKDDMKKADVTVTPECQEQITKALKADAEQQKQIDDFLNKPQEFKNSTLNNHPEITDDCKNEILTTSDVKIQECRDKLRTALKDDQEQARKQEQERKDTESAKLKNDTTTPEPATPSPKTSAAPGFYSLSLSVPAALFIISAILCF